jgi:hypothetical protein
VSNFLPAYGAIVSTAVAIFQGWKEWRNRPRLRVTCSFHEGDGRRTTRGPFLWLHLSNVGDRDMPITAPRVQIGTRTGERRYLSPDEQENDSRWEELDGHYDSAFVLRAIDRVTYRYRIPQDAKIRRCRVTDRAGIVRYSKRLRAESD